MIEKEEPGEGYLESGRQPKDAIGNNSHGHTAVTTALLLCLPVVVLLSYNSYFGYLCSWKDLGHVFKDLMTKLPQNSETLKE